jgi:hypothetical protein
VLSQEGLCSLIRVQTKHKHMDPREDEHSQDELDNHADQLNPNNDAYWQSRGEDERPDDWRSRTEDEDD